MYLIVIYICQGGGHIGAVGGNLDVPLQYRLYSVHCNCYITAGESSYNRTANVFCRHTQSKKTFNLHLIYDLLKIK